MQFIRFVRLLAAGNGSAMLPHATTKIPELAVKLNCESTANQRQVGFARNRKCCWGRSTAEMARLGRNAVWNAARDDPSERKTDCRRDIETGGRRCAYVDVLSVHRSERNSTGNRPICKCTVFHLQISHAHTSRWTQMGGNYRPSAPLA
jgi:hypothetical protein